jgi:hypothetical protein
MKQERTIKTRNRDAGQIATEAQSDLWTAHEIAVHGRKRTPLARAIWKYLYMMDDGFADSLRDRKMKLAFLRGGPAIKDWLESNEGDEAVQSPIVYRRAAAGELCKLFLDAVKRRDVPALKQIASEVKQFTLDPPAMDLLRAGILTLKSMLEQRREKMTINDLAALLNRRSIFDNPEAPSTENGHAKLRELAKALRFPIAKDKIGRPKKAKP